MDRPSWERKFAEQERETLEQMRKQGERESFRNSMNFIQGDYLGMDDGRPGIGLASGIGGTIVTMPLAWRIISSIAGLALIALLAFGTRACIGEERAQEILNKQPPAATESGSGLP